MWGCCGGGGGGVGGRVVVLGWLRGGGVVFLGGCSHGFLQGEFREWGERRGEGFVFLFFSLTIWCHSKIPREEGMSEWKIDNHRRHVAYKWMTVTHSSHKVQTAEPNC